jgi:hypothetical protein
MAVCYYSVIVAVRACVGFSTDPMTTARRRRETRSGDAARDENRTGRAGEAEKKIIIK